MTAATEVPVRVDASPRSAPVWLSLGALALGGFGIGTTEFATMGVLPDVTGDLGASIPQGGHLVSAYALGVVVGAPLLAVLGARLPRKVLLLALMTAFTLGNALSAMAPSFGSLELARFATGLPHGAYFGIASIVAASLVPPGRRSRAVARVMLGLTVANIVGVPLATTLGQQLGWRSTYWAAAVIGGLAVLAVGRVVPPVAAAPGAGPARELGALRRPQVLLALLVGATGFGGFFAVYSYISPTLTRVSGFRESAVPLALALFGLGMTVGTELGGRLADRSVVRTIYTGMAASGATLLLFMLTAHQRGHRRGDRVPHRADRVDLPAGAADPADGRGRRRAVAGRRRQPRRAEHRQRARRLPRRPGHRGRPRLHRAGRGRRAARRRRARRAGRVPGRRAPRRGSGPDGTWDGMRLPVRSTRPAAAR